MAEKGRINLVVSAEKEPDVSVAPGQELQVVAVMLQGPDVAKIKKVGARLCGGTTTCLALIDIDDNDTESMSTT